jgi:hypothetical protein
MTIMAPLFNMNWLEFSWLSTGIKDATEDNADISMYPNPTRGTLFVESVLEESWKGEIQVLDLMGRQVMSKPIDAMGSFTEKLDLNGLISGSCFVVVRKDSGEIFSRSLVVVND